MTDRTEPRVLPHRGWLAAWALLLFVVATIALLVFVLPEEDTRPIPRHWMLPAGVDAWEAGHEAYGRGELEQAVAYWKQVSPQHPQYARSLRFIGWEVYAEKLNSPRRALSYVHRSVLEEPLESNTWQDLGRTYAALIGLNDGSSARRAVHSTTNP